MTKRIWLVDAGTGNLRSVQHALESLEADVVRTDRPDDLKNAGCLVLPGVGAFGAFMAGLNERGLSDVIISAVKAGKPVLGICVGMQALFDVSFEMGEFPGLGLIPGKVVKFPPIQGIKIPHTGWNQLHPVRSNPLFDGLSEGCYAYFNHSFYCEPSEKLHMLATTDYGMDFTSVVQKENLFGVQFHPEKSQRTGLTILSNFLKLA